MVSGGQERIGRDRAGKPVALLRQQAQADQSAPVLAEESDVAEIELAQESAHPVEMSLVGVVRAARRLVAAAESRHVGGDRAQPRAGEDRDHLAVEVAPGGLAMEEEHRRTSALVDVVKAKAIDFEIARSEGPSGKSGKALVGSAQDLHWAIKAA